MLRCSLVASLLVGLVGALHAQEQAPAAVSVFGRVTDLLGEGIPAAEVWITGKDGAVLGRTVADGEGLYRIMRLPVARDASLDVHARAKGFMEHGDRVAGIGPARAASLQLEEGAPLGGTVVRADGSPIAGAAVSVTTRADGHAPWKGEVTADERGVWRIATAPVRSLRVNAWAPGFVVADEVVDGANEAVRIALEASPIASRRVRVTGVPAGVAAVVRCTPWSNTADAFARLPTAMCSVPVAADGTAVIWPLPVHHDLRVEAVGFACVPAEIARVRNSSGTTSGFHDFALVAAPAASAPEKAPTNCVTAKVVDPDGKPLAGVPVLVRYDMHDVLMLAAFDAAPGQVPPPLPESLVEARTDADGKFVVPGSRSDEEELALAVASEQWHFADEVRRCDDLGRMWVAMPKDGLVHAARAGSIRGVLRTSSGQVLAGARVEVVGKSEGSFSSASDEAGRVEIRVPVGDYELRVTAIDGRPLLPIPASCTRGAAVAFAALAFGTVGEVQGVVRDKDGKPRVHAGVDLREADVGDGTGSHCVSVRTDRRGCFRAPNLRVGKWFVADARSGEHVEVQVRAGKVAEVAVER